MTIYPDTFMFGWPGDAGLGERLIRQVIAGAKTATCSPKVDYSPDELAAVYAGAGRPHTVLNVDGIPRCNVLITEVFETTFGDPDPRLVRGEGDGDDVAKFQRDHIGAWADDMTAAGHPLTPQTLLVAELFELIERPEHPLREDGDRYGSIV